MKSSSRFSENSRGLPGLVLVLLFITEPVSGQVPRYSRTTTTGTFNGKELAYTAVAEETLLYGNGDTDPAASVITFSYFSGNDELKKVRPVIFIFNGGPGASSSPLHLHAFGPRIFPASGHGPMTGNNDCLLDVADLVFIDPAGTGYTRIFKPDSCAKYWDVKGDAASIIYVIKKWQERYDRKDSPVYLCGESYGTIRAAEMLGIGSDLPVAGVIMLSAAFDMSSWMPVAGNDLPYIESLPSMAAIAKYHGKGSLSEKDGSAAFSRAYGFASGKYLSALARGSSIPAAEKKRIASELSALTGLPADTILARDLRISAEDFEMLLLAGENKRIGQLDGRKTGPSDNGLKPPYNDPSMGRSDTSAVRRMKEYFNNSLGLRDTGRYRSLNLDVNTRWSWTSALKEFYFTVLPELSKAAAMNPDLKIMIAGGIFDLATPLAAARYQAEHSGIRAGRVIFEPFPTGHSIFEDPHELKVLADMIRSFVSR